MKIVISLFVLMLLALPTFAQDDTATCPANIDAVIDTLSGLDDLAPEEALARVVEARATLQQIELECARAGVVLLTETFTAPEERFTVDYPSGWFVGTYNPTAAGGVLFLGSSPAAERLLQIEQPRIVLGEQALQVVVGLPPEQENTTLETVMSDFLVPLTAIYTDISTTSFYEVGDRTLAQISYRGDGFDGVVIGAEVGDGRFTIVRGVTAGGNLDALTAVAEEVALSVR